LVAGLPINVPKWDDLKANHIVALYKCTGRNGNNITITWVGNLLKDAFALAIDLHDTTMSRVVPAVSKFYVPKALSTLLEMGPALTGHPALVNAKFIDPYNLNPSFKNFVWSYGVSEAEIALVQRAKSKSAAVRSMDVVEVPSEVYQQQMSFVRVQEQANKEASDRFLKTAENKAFEANVHGLSVDDANKEVLGGQRAEFGRMMFYDANNVGYTVQSNGAQMQEMTNNNLAIQRQFEGPEQHQARLGTFTLNYTFENFLSMVLSDPTMHEAFNAEEEVENSTDKVKGMLFAHLDVRMLSLQTARVFTNENNFKLACLWCWSPASAEKVNLSWFLSAGSEFSQFQYVTDIGHAMSEVQAFLCVTFGSIWNRCTLCLQEAIRDSHNLRVLNVTYLRYKLESEMAFFGSRLKKAAGTFADRAGYWVGQFERMLCNYIASANSIEEVQFTVFVLNKRNKPKSTVNTVMPPPVGVVSKALSKNSSLTKELCIKYMKHAFNVINPATNTVYDTCGKMDCERYHNQIFEKTKQTVLTALHDLKTGGSHKALIDAVVADPRLK
jgi:hypothetical protein